MLNRKSTLTAVAAAVLALATSFTVLAQTTTGSNPTANRLADSYSTSVGLTEPQSKNLIGAMRKGEDITITTTTTTTTAGTTSTTTTVTGTGKTMGYGNINIALSLAKAEAAKTEGTFLSSLDTVMDRRASGMGWGQIAKELGFNLGQVMSASKTEKSASKSATGTAKASDAGKSGKAGSV